MANGFGLPGFLERWKSDWIDPAIDYIEGQRPRSDSHLNDVSIEYPEVDIQVATQNFDPACLLGSGTFGSVYRGTMGDGTEVAIKVLQVPQEAGFEDEVKVLSRFRHPNLVILMGFARHLETGGRSLIYEYLAGGDVSKRLQRSRSNSESFEWKARLSAALDAACGLSHLHNMSPRAFHRDIKGPNILLDKNGTAKMADFGLSCVSTGSQHKVQQASGTVGYACPEYIRTGIITEGSEVHSFGMVILELLTGAPPAVQRQDKPNEFCYLVDHLQGSSAKVIQMLDSTAHFPLQVAQALTEVAFRCITPVSSERPLFKHLVEELRFLNNQPTEDRLIHTTKVGTMALQARPTAGAQQHPAADRAAVQQRPASGNRLPLATPQRPGIRPVVLGQGAQVECRWRGRSGWFCGRVARVNQNGTFAIRYNDGDFEDNVPGHLIRPMEVPVQIQAAAQQPRNVEGTPGPLAGASRVPASPQVTPNCKTPAHMSSAQHGHAVNLPAPPPPLPGLESTNAGTQPAASPQTTVPKWVRGAHDDVLSSGSQPCRLWCVYAEGVELSRLSDQQRAISVPAAGQDLIVGRTAQPAALWDTLVPDRRLHGTVSREHFRVISRSAPSNHAGGPEQTTFFLLCMSLNGILLNSKYVGQGEGEKCLRHGDVIAFAASAESAGHGGGMRKPFIVFSFELLGCGVPAVDKMACSSPSPLPQQHPVHANPQEEQEPEEEDEGGLQQRPPANTVAGRWRTAEAGAAVPPDAVFCLEVHGEYVRMDLASEMRQIFLCCENSPSALPALRIGRNYQRNFWQRVMHRAALASSTWPSIMAVDHFDIYSMRRSNPMSSEQPDWHFRLRVLASAGVAVKYSVVCNTGDDCELQQGYTLSVGTEAISIPGEASFDPTGVKAPRGLHFTFIPLVGSFASPGASSIQERPRQLPETHMLWADGDEALAEVRPVAPLTTSKVGTLRPPTALLLGQAEVEDELADSADLEQTSAANQLPMRMHSSAQRQASQEEIASDPDDLFSRTGFGLARAKGLQMDKP